jgi:L-malate glycosyltransferase
MKTGILFLIDRLAIGGTERQLLELVRNLDGTRFRPHLCTLHKHDQDQEEKEIPHLDLGFEGFHHPNTLRCLGSLVRYIWQNRIGIVQTFFQDPFLLAALSRPFHRARLVGSFRDLGFWRNRAQTIKMRLAYPAFSGFIANSQAVKEHFAEADGIDPTEISVIYNGVIERPACVKRARDRNSLPTIGIVANLNRPVKRVQDFVHAAVLVHRRHPDARFFVVGDGHLKEQLDRLSNALGLGAVLKFAGLVQDPLEYAGHFDVGVVTSETEGFCNAILEYMACGVPVVATAAGGNLEMVKEGENGFLVPVGNVEMMADRIDLLLKREDLRSKMGTCSLARVETEFSMPRMVAAHEKYYEGLLAAEGRHLITQNGIAKVL